MASKDDRRGDAAGLRKQSEEAPPEKAAQSPEDLDSLSPEEMRRMLHELRARQAQLEAQNEALCLAQKDGGAASILESISDAFFSMNDEMVVTYFNHAAEAALGRSSEEVFGRRLFDAFPEARGSIFEEQYTRALKEKIQVSFETYFGVSPYENWYDVRVYPNPEGISVFFQLITERKRVGEALRESEKRFRSYFESPIIGVAITSPEKGWLEANQRLCAMLGYSRDELLGLTWAELTHPDDLAADVAQFERLLSGEIDSYSMEKRFISKSGEVIWTHLGVGCVRKPGGDVDYVVPVIRNITEGKQAEDALRESQRMLRYVLDTIPQSVFWKDAKGVFLGCNEVFARSIGLNSPEDIGGKTDFDLPVPRNDAEAYRADDMDVVLNNTPKLHIIESVLRADGMRIWADTSKLPLRDEQGNACGVLGVYEDITNRKRSEEILREKEALLSETQHIAHIGSWTVDMGSMQTTWTEESYRIFGVSPDGFVPSAKSFLELVHGDDRRVMEKWVQDCIDGKHPTELEFRAVLPDQTIRHLCARGDRYSAGDGGAPRLVGSVQDVTDRKRAEEEKGKLETQLQQAQKLESVGRLAGGVAHDFNNMLQVILGNADLAMNETAPGSPLRASIEEIQHSAQRSADLTRQLLAFARKQTVAPQVLDLNKTVEGMLKMLRRLIGENIDLKWQPGANLWAINMDPSQIDQIMANLCVNARDAITDVGKLTIETKNSTFDEDYCKNHEGFAPGEYVQLAVSDSGCGMDPETLAHIFEPFFTTKGAGEGTGLGLATVYGAVKQNNGFINACSEPGHGTTFTIYLPRHVGKAEQIRTAGAAKPYACGHETILLVEDEPSVLRLTTMLLKGQGYTVLPAITPGDAIRLAQEYDGEINLLITDIIMPEMNGRDLAKNVQFLYPNIQRLFMSGYTADTIARQGVLDKGVHFIQKPFSTETLAAKIREALDSE